MTSSWPCADVHRAGGAKKEIPMDRPHGFGPWLKQHRKARDLTQDALAHQIGCTATTIRRIEAGTRRPSRQIAERLVQVLAIALDDQPAIVGFARDTLRPIVSSPHPSAGASHTVDRSCRATGVDCAAAHAR
jgi:transcriptional regulator with XRE-family HTH domain